MQIICPNCGSKSPIEAGSLVTQTRIVCARCAVEFAAELSDEQAAAPTATAGERGIELFQVAEVAPAFVAPAFVAPVSLAQPVPMTEEADAAPEAEVVPVEEIVASAEVVAAAEEVAPAEEASAVEPVQEALPAAAVVSPVVEIAGAAEVSPVATSSDVPTASEVYEVLSLPEEAVLSDETAASASVAEEDHANVLEDVFAAWNQSRESKHEADTVVAASNGAAEDYVTSPLAADYETTLRGESRRESEPTERQPVEVLDAAAGEAVVPVEYDAAEAAPTAEAAVASGDEHEPVGETLADVSVPPMDVPVPPQVAAARSLDGYGLGVRLMRVSPLWLLVSGLSFISFVVFCNWFFVPANLAQADATRPASHRNEAANRSLVSAASAAGVAAERSDSRNDNAGRASLPAEGEVVNASLKIEEPTPAPTAPPATPAPTAEPAATPEAVQPKAEAAAAPQPVPSGRFTVQVGSYNAPAEAEARAAGLRSAGQTVRVAEVEIPKRGKWYRVYVGGFASRTDAESHGRSLRERGLAESFIATESN